MSSRLPSEKRPWRYPLLVLLIGAAVFDFVAPYLMRSVSWGSGREALGTSVAAAAVGQAGLLAMFGVLGPLRLRVQWPGSVGVAVGFLWLFIMSDSFGSHYWNWEQFLGPALVAPLVFMLGQLPFWAMWLFRGARIVRVRPDGSHAAPESRQAGIKHLLVAMAALAIAFPLAQWAFTRGVEEQRFRSAMLLRMVMFGLGWAGVNTLAVWPCLWAALAARRTSSGLIFLAIYAAVASFVPATIAAIFASRLEGELLVYPPIFVALLAVILYAPLRLARRYGYVVLGLSRRRPVLAEPEGESPFREPPVTGAAPPPADQEELL